jgi:hypothetical protein
MRGGAIGARNSPVMRNLEYCRLAALRISVFLGWEDARLHTSKSISGQCSREPFGGQRGPSRGVIKREGIRSRPRSRSKPAEVEILR